MTDGTVNLMSKNKMMPNKSVNTDVRKRRAFIAPLTVADYLIRQLYKTLYKFIILIIALCLSVDSYAQKSPTFPHDWRAPTNADYSKVDLSYMNIIAPSHIIADFNGDGLKDEAWILLKKSESLYGLFVFIGAKGKSYKTIKLIEFNKGPGNLYMGISILESGLHKTACGKGYWECAEGVPEILSLENPGINFFKFESANSVFYWDTTKKEFKRIWLSD